MKKFRFATIILLIVFALALTACSPLETEQGNTIKASCKAMLDAVIADDMDAAFAVLSTGANRQQFASVFMQIRQYISGVSNFELEQIGWYSGVKNGESYYEATFEMTTNAGTYHVTGVTVTGYDNLYSFSIVNADEVRYTGTLTTLSGSTPIQWGILLLNLVSLAFVICMVVDCAKRRMKFKSVWIIWMIIGVITLTLKHAVDRSTNLNFNFGIVFLQYSHMKQYADGSFILQLLVPVGAIVYFFLRKKVTLPAAIATVTVSSDPAPQPPAAEAEAPTEAEIPSEPESPNET